MNKKILASLTIIVLFATIFTLASVVVPTFAANDAVSSQNEEPPVPSSNVEVNQTILETADEDPAQAVTETTSENTTQASTPEETCEPTLVDVAIAVNSDGDYAGLFDTLIAAVLAADPAVVDTLTSCDQYTVFAPTDDAFAALGLTPDTVGSVDQGLLTDILLYHVASGRLDSSAVISSDSICTLKQATLRQSGGVLTDKLGRDATIIVTDVEAANGIIHVIDAVVLPCEARALIE